MSEPTAWEIGLYAHGALVMSLGVSVRKTRSALIRAAQANRDVILGVATEADLDATVVATRTNVAFGNIVVMWTGVTRNDLKARDIV